MPVRRLLKSCATPPRRRPMDSRFSVFAATFGWLTAAVLITEKSRLPSRKSAHDSCRWIRFPSFRLQIHSRGCDLGENTSPGAPGPPLRSEEHTSELQSRFDLVCRLLRERK